MKSAKRPDIVSELLRLLTEAEQQLGRKLDWERHLPQGRRAFSAREVCNAIGRTLTEAGIINNLERKS